MNRKMLAKTLHFRMRLRPVAERFDAMGRKLPQEDDDWIVDGVHDDGLRLVNVRTGHCPMIPYDHIKEFRSDLSVRDGVQHGFLMLLSQMRLQGDRATLEPFLLGDWVRGGK